MVATRPQRWRHIIQKYPVLVGEDPFRETEPWSMRDFDMIEAMEKGEPGTLNLDPIDERISKDDTNEHRSTLEE